MKTFLFSLALLLSTQAARANSLASIYNGEQYKLDGYTLVQDANSPDNFYVLPHRYQIKSETFYNRETDKYESKYGVTHHIDTDSAGARFSIYTISMTLDEPGRTEKSKASLALHRDHSSSAKIVGLAPVCGMRLDVPGAVSNTPLSPSVTLATYSIKSSSGQCDSILDTTDFSLNLRVPMEQEPGFAKMITSEVGIVLPPLELLLPYKYKDKVTLSINASNAYERMKTSAGLTGTWKVIQANVQVNTESALNQLAITGGIVMDCQNQDKTACDLFLKQAQDILNQIFLKYIPLATNPEANTTPIAVQAGDKGASSAMFRVDLSMDKAEAQSLGTFNIDFTNSVYSSIHTQVQLDISNVPPEVLDPAVRRQLNGLN